MSETATSFAARIAIITGGLTPSQIPDEPLGVVGCIFARSPHGWLRGVDPLLVWETDQETKYQRYVISDRSADLAPWDGVSRGLTGIGDPIGLDPVPARAAQHGRWMILTDGDASEVSARECAARNAVEWFAPGWTFSGQARATSSAVGSDRRYRSATALNLFGSLLEASEQEVAGAACLVPRLVAVLGEGPGEDVLDSRRATSAWLETELYPRIRDARGRGADRGEIMATIRGVGWMVGRPVSDLVRAALGV